MTKKSSTRRQVLKAAVGVGGAVSVSSLRSVNVSVQGRPVQSGRPGTHFFLGVAAGDRGPSVGLSISDGGVYGEHDTGFVPGELLHLRASIDRGRLRFAVSPDGTEWTDVGPELDATGLSDDYGSALRFTGAFVGLAAHDPATGTPAGRLRLPRQLTADAGRCACQCAGPGVPGRPVKQTARPSNATWVGRPTGAPRCGCPA